MNYIEKEIFGRKLRIEQGRMAKQSHGAVVVTFNESTILTTANASEKAKEGIDFLPLTVEFQERFYSVGRIPGGFMKREGKPSQDAILASRLIDRPIRPLFPKEFHNEIQVINTPFSMMGDDSIDTWGITGASLALNISPIPFSGIVAGVRVGYVDGEYIAFPTREQLEKSEIDIIVAGTKDAVTMVEGEALEVTEKIMVDGIMFAHAAIKQIISIEEEFISKFDIEKWEVEKVEIPEDFVNGFEKLIDKKEMLNRLLVDGKKNKDKLLGEYKKSLMDSYSTNFDEEYFVENKKYLGEVFEDTLKNVMRRSIVENNVRADKRNIDQVRPITCETSVIPRVHGSALFTRGETQSLGIVTLGSESDIQRVDTIFSEEQKRFILHYNFPPYATGEVKGLRGISRREIGHGHLAERAHKNLIPSETDFPYTIRVVSEILESNGSSSMATVCSASLSMMDAGVPLKKHVAGIAMGLIFEEDKHVVLTDILGIEDHLGDMDFKVTGTRDGITAFQMDVKVDKVDAEIMTLALEKARIGRNSILNLMYDAIPEPRKELSPYVPIIKTTTVPVDKIGDVIGPGGRVIKDINKTFEVDTDITDDGLVKISGFNAENVKKAIEHVNNLMIVIKSGETYQGKITRKEKYGVFVEIAPGKIGLLHATKLVSKIAEVKIGDSMKVKVTRVENQGKFALIEDGFVEKKRVYKKEMPKKPVTDSKKEDEVK